LGAEGSGDSIGEGIKSVWNWEGIGKEMREKEKRWKKDERERERGSQCISVFQRKSWLHLC
jgi:hypothetical protein